MNAQNFLYNKINIFVDIFMTLTLCESLNDFSLPFLLWPSHVLWWSRLVRSLSILYKPSWLSAQQIKSLPCFRFNNRGVVFMQGYILIYNRSPLHLVTDRILLTDRRRRNSIVWYRDKGVFSFPKLQIRSSQDSQLDYTVWWPITYLSPERGF